MRCGPHSWAEFAIVAIIPANLDDINNAATTPRNAAEKRH
jgi:hypothetical protein